MTQTEKQLIEKLEEYQKLLYDELDEVVVMMSVHGWKSHRYEQGEKLRNEIAALKQQVEQEEKTDLDDEFVKLYLNECIEKATPNLSKIKDVDKALDEIRGISDISEDDKKSTIDQFVRMTAKYTLELFMMLGLKTHIEAMVVNEPTKEEFIFSFKKVQQEEKTVSDEEIIKILNDNIKIEYKDSWTHEEYHSYPYIIGFDKAVIELRDKLLNK